MTRNELRSRVAQATGAPLLPEPQEAAVAAQAPLDRFTPLDKIEHNIAASEFLTAMQAQGQFVNAETALAEISKREAMRMAEFMARTGRDPRLPQNQNPSRSEQRTMVFEASQGRAQLTARLRRGFDPFGDPFGSVERPKPKPKAKPRKKSRRQGADPGEPPNKPRPLKRKKVTRRPLSIHKRATDPREARPEILGLPSNRRPRGRRT